MREGTETPSQKLTFNRNCRIEADNDERCAMVNSKAMHFASMARPLQLLSFTNLDGHPQIIVLPMYKKIATDDFQVSLPQPPAVLQKSSKA